MASAQIEESIAKYEAFINDVLKEDLKKVDWRLQQINAEITDLIQQKHTLEVVTSKEKHPEGFKTQVNIGCNFFMEASVPDTSTMLINVGLNNFLEFPAEEVVKYLDVRIKAFERKAEELKDQSAKTKAHIKLMLFGIGELQEKATKKG
ncbi:protein UXT homolog [Leguminivora glycinivorella]|uniref:protein UXT homolog n=1 Tax=Leguminivora glycinivorella TaxID=1035111 RepID=UPI00200DFFAB|nr:protein UXT homolog [Leguminivora glycinivorella]